MAAEYSLVRCWAVAVAWRMRCTPSRCRATATATACSPAPRPVSWRLPEVSSSASPMVLTSTALVPPVFWSGPVAIPRPRLACRPDRPQDGARAIRETSAAEVQYLTCDLASPRRISRNSTRRASPPACVPRRPGPERGTLHRRVADGVERHSLCRFTQRKPGVHVPVDRHKDLRCRHERSSARRPVICCYSASFTGVCAHAWRGIEHQRPKKPA